VAEPRQSACYDGTMGLSVGNRERSVRSDINITPLVDVVLVLLIIFMVLVPIMMRQVVIDVPPAPEVGTVSTQKPVKLLLKNDLSVVLDDGDREQTVRGADLARLLRPVLDAKTAERVVFVDFEAQVAWRDVISVIDTVHGNAGAQVALLVREPGDPLLGAP
jgi:biopolymer transport protein TolR